MLKELVRTFNFWTSKPENTQATRVLQDIGQDAHPNEFAALCSPCGGSEA